MGIFDAIKNSFPPSGLADYWHAPEDSARISEIIDQSHERPQLLYKHSPRSATCFFARKQVEEAADDIHKQADLHFVDVIGSWPVSNRITEELGVQHESPQLLLVSNGEVVWHVSHGEIKTNMIVSQL